ncbi:energy transducer TonB [Rufibacter immobilis]|uniref:Energy transducer TonB n=1 Tax=Rufibacter immobilis TaxID=1348778 RepID=A0A3M9MX88_9BACT|nr:energy transducer TonB [Rufibacter immobilis]RNI29483.1 energy transducer TonB [Rufibacter immobilis]
METKTTYPATLDDMIFEGRNKAYGAYVLRKLYDRHISQAVLYAIALFLFGFSVPFVANLLVGQDVQAAHVKPKTESKWVEVVLPQEEQIKEVPKAEEPAAAQPAARTVKNVTVKVVPESTPVVDEVPTQEELKTANSGLVASEGDGGANLNSPTPGAGSGSGTGTGTDGGSEPPANSIFYSVEHMPEFEGGLQKLMDFVGRSLHYPRAAQANGVEGTVVVSFVVAASGDLTDIQILKGLGFGTEEEVLRVMKKLPRWKPGNQNGRNVPVRMTLPIRLELK